jgi:hypothetical protein
MLKIVICLTRKPEMTRTEFQRRWNKHAVLVTEVASSMGIRRMIQNHTITTPLDEGIRRGRGAPMDDYDGVAETWFDSSDALIAATLSDEGNRAAQRLAEDEATFIDFPRSRIFFVEEHLVVNREPASKPSTLKIVICLKRKPNMSRAEFLRYWKEDHARVIAVVAQPMGMRRNVHNHTITTPLDERIRRGRGAEIDDYDGVAESWFDSLQARVATNSTDEGRYAAQRLAEDEARFIDYSRSRMFFVEEHVVIDGGSPV